MKILIINGSPNVDGNTAALANAFAEGAKEAGNDVSIINVGKKKIAGCMGCMGCKKNGGTCVQNDDMGEVIEAYKTADAVVFASPVYYFNVTAQLSAATQRMFAIGKPPLMKKGGLILSSGSPGVYDGAVAGFKAMCGYFGVTDTFVITAAGAENKSEAKLAEAKALGKAIN